MTVIRVAFMLTKTGLFGSTLSKTASQCVQKHGAVTTALNIRHLSSLELSKNLELISKEKKTTKVANLKLNEPQDRPMVILLSWLMAKRKHIHKFANYYVGHGFDVLNVSISPWQLLWPTKGSQIVASEILKFLEVNRSYSPLVLHGFSVGGYVWGEALVQIASDLQRYQHIVERMEGQVWDSVADVTEICIGVPVAVFPKNKVLQTALKQYMLYHLKTFDKVATCHYVRASQMFHTNVITVPAQFFLSKTDPIGSETSISRARESWENMGIKVYWKCWDNSGHVGHFRRYPTEYVDEMNSFLNSIGVLSQREKMQAKV